MKKEKIISLAYSMGFLLNYDKYDNKEYPGSRSELRFLRFVSTDSSLDEPDLRWVWYKDDSDEENIKRGKYVQRRIQRKKEIQDFLKY
jgi:hypothetical protein